ncbi:PREDICTED: putative transmembrane protein LINC00998 isoform X2 [Vollenhovia emeryi]|uniref:putative transmembrane protein LINC00998 isoform X2 n=1 Tax=Vollenhovia emeryi TaxID=411798 RepID=UPI0005F48784|nr:PREDICTED: putative transmembrane protein LINC00998 isoform X2 [Vollenhovia emeryi]
MWAYYLLVASGILDVAMASDSFDFGDTLALILGLTIAIVGFFACMGAYARRRGHFESLTREI